MGCSQEISQVPLWVDLWCLHRQQSPKLCLDHGQARCCTSLLSSQLGQLQLPAVLYYRVGKTNINADALSRMFWLGCMPDTSDTHVQVSVAVVWAIVEATLESLMSPIEAYSSDLHILDSVEDSPQVTCMTIDDWHQAQCTDLVLSLITRLQDGAMTVPYGVQPSQVEKR